MILSGIYKIQSKIKPERIYIGSAENINKRWITHINYLRNNKHHSIKLQRHFNKYGENDIVFIIIELCLPAFLTIREQYYINELKPWFNICPLAGSPLGYKHREESKEKMSNSKKGYIPWNKNKKGLQIAWNKGLIGYRKGIKFTENHKRKLSEAAKGRKIPLEQIIKLSIAAKKANIGRNCSNEAKRKISEANKGRIFTKEHREKLSVAQKKYRLNKITILKIA